jgi:cation diffusion facilitator family transporter
LDAQSLKKATHTTLFSIVGSGVLVAVKLFAGLLGNSFALVADGIESSADILSSLFVLIGIRYAAQPADKNHPYGHGKIEPMITFIVVAFLFFSAGFIIWQSIYNIQHAHEQPKVWTLYVLIGIILWKEVSYRFVMKRAKELNSSSLKADAWHHRSDAITSLAAFVGITLAIYLGEGYEALDDWAALIASGFIVYNAYKIFRPALSEVMDEHVYPDLESDIHCISKQVSGVVNTEKCYIRKAGMVFHVELHARVDANISVREGHIISHRLKDTLNEQLPQLGNVVIHIEPN